MKKTILITGSTDGIGYETAKMLVEQGHYVLLHGRSPEKLAHVQQQLASLVGEEVEGYVADLSVMSDVEALAMLIKAKHPRLDVLINNAGVNKVTSITTVDNLDVRFMVNSIAPFLLTERLLPLFDNSGRIVNLSSAAQSPVDLAALASANAGPNDARIYAQSKLALTMWSAYLADILQPQGPAIIAVNPASYLGTKMVKQAYGVNGNDVRIGADILCRAALSAEFAHASGEYYDNDTKQFAAPHPDAMNPQKNAALVATIKSIIASKILN